MIKRCKCNHCSEIFEQQDAPTREETERSEAWGQIAVTTAVYVLCPSCGSENWSEVWVCECEQAEPYGDEDYCEACLKAGEYHRDYEPLPETVAALELDAEGGPEHVEPMTAAERDEIRADDIRQQRKDDALTGDRP